VLQNLQASKYRARKIYSSAIATLVLGIFFFCLDFRFYQQNVVIISIVSTTLHVLHSLFTVVYP
jgi:hypothetical protein